MMSLEKQISQIGNKLVNCGQKQECKDIRNIPAKGILPRCLFWQSIKDRMERGMDEHNNNHCFAIGLNPGAGESKKKKKNTVDGLTEQEYYKREKNTYAATVKFWKEAYWDYYSNTEKLLRELDFKGNIIWTELAHCESKINGNVSKETIENCRKKWLVEELAVAPNWPFITLGGKAFKSLKKEYSNKTIIGLYHPTGNSRPPHDFKTMDAIINTLKGKAKAVRYIKENKNKAIHLSDILDGNDLR